jgi:hypothetical protein
MAGSDVRSDTPAALLRARAELLGELTGIARVIPVSAASRCPYRGRHDACTFGAACRNQRRGGGRELRCSGAPLDACPVNGQARFPG